jgi:hypothetical protein
MRCSYIKRNKKQCRANAVSGQPFCFLHSSPGKASEMGARGGARRKTFDLSKLKHFPPAKSATDLVEVTAQTLADVRSGAIDAKAANAVAGLAGVLVKLLEATSLEERLTRLEKIAEDRRHARSN